MKNLFLGLVMLFGTASFANTLDSNKKSTVEATASEKTINSLNSTYGCATACGNCYCVTACGFDDNIGVAIRVLFAIEEE